MSSKHPQNKCCLTNIRNSELLIAKNVFRYFHIERKLQLKLAIKQTEIVTKINSDICAQAANDFLLVKQSEIGVKTIQIPSGISLKVCVDESDKNVLQNISTSPTTTTGTTVDQIKPFNVELDSMISSLKKPEKKLSNLSEIKEIVKNYETKNSPPPKSVPTTNLSNTTTELEPTKSNEIQFAPHYESSQTTGEINVALQTTFAEKLNKKNEKIEMIKSFLETQKDVKQILTEDLIVKENHVQKSGSMENINARDIEDKKVQKLLILEPPIKWKDMRLINSMNYIPKQSILRNYDDNIISQIRYIIHRFYLKYGRAPNIKNICNVIQSLCSIQKDHTDLIYRIIAECCGFFQQRSLMNPIFFERRFITESRLKYLKKIDEYREKKYKIYYLYIKVNYSKSKSWVNVIESILTKNKTNCNQLIAIAQIASEQNGLLPQYTKIFHCGRSECIDPSEFETWLDQTITSFVPLDKSVLVFGEHVPFYSKFGKHPNNGTWNIQDQEEWFKERGNYTSIEESMKETVTKYVRLQQKFEKKIKLLFLPLLHFELNPIKYFWQALLKTFSQKINKNYVKFQSLDDSVKFQIFKKIFATVENTSFGEYLRKVQEVEKFYLRSTPLLMEGDIQRNSLQFDLKFRKQNTKKNNLKRHLENVKGKTEESEQPAIKKNKICMNKNNTLKIDTMAKSNNIKKPSPITSTNSSGMRSTNTILPTAQTKRNTSNMANKIQSASTSTSTSNMNMVTFRNKGDIKLPVTPISAPSKLLTNTAISKNGKKIGPKSFMNKPSTTTKAEPSKSGILFIEKEAPASLIQNENTQNTDHLDNFEMSFNNIEIKQENTFMDSYDTSLSNYEHNTSNNLKIQFVHSGVGAIMANVPTNKNETVISSANPEIDIKEEINYNEYDEPEPEPEQNYNENELYNY